MARITICDWCKSAVHDGALSSLIVQKNETFEICSGCVKELLAQLSSAATPKPERAPSTPQPERNKDLEAPEAPLEDADEQDVTLPEELRDSEYNEIPSQFDSNKARRAATELGFGDCQHPFPTYIDGELVCGPPPGGVEIPEKIGKSNCGAKISQRLPSKPRSFSFGKGRTS